ncbi:hypothetical protein QWY75_05590 [Pontixanthobacter aestiaquae]|uniref:Uncharacterized protein n=1 Tax=Pontixanthobacter aestiaquae TaxID=1509367 RepID=A0A844Z740_9SPHN|nr:hypothetical protein [Pontixanthobacter aestiaquae]MDN3645678.1 hypothetical protein [Pontixanthobacter aestiaquae]MXO83324.1 hypothetical protein [Pontixanthobacter aestiaquae]
MKIGRIFGIFAALAALVSAPVMAQDGQSVALNGDVMVVKTISEDGAEPRTELVEPNLVVPGDRLLFRTNYENTSAELVENFVVTNPLSSAVQLASDTPADQVASVDGGKTFGALSTLTVTEEGGAVRAALASDVTHLRWTLASLEPGESGQITFYAIVR